MSMLSAGHASFVVRWETIDTMVCNILSGVKTDVCASIDLLLALDVLELETVIWSLFVDTYSTLGVVGSVVGC